jgi:hypothetical protein
MKSKGRWIAVFGIIAGASLQGAWRSQAATAQGSDDPAAIMSVYESAERAAANAREKDAAWKPSCKQVNLIQIADTRNPAALKNFCLNKDGNILACFAGAAKASDPKKASGIRVYSPKGDLLKTFPLEITPEAIGVGSDGMIFAAGEGKLLKLDDSGKVVASVASPVAKETVTITKETEDMVREMVKQNNRPFKDELAKIKTSLEKRRSNVTGLAVTDQDVFMAVPAPSDFSFRVYRFNHDLSEPKLVVEKLRGCCGQMDIQSHDGKLWIPHNARHAVETHDRDGKELTKFGKAGKVKASDFGGCCEPKNLRVMANGDVLAAESGPPTCIKRFTADGKFKEVIAVVDGSKGDCVRVTVERSPDGRQYYMLDTTKGAIHVFAAKS